MWMTLKEQIMKLQTYKMYEGEDTVYVELDDILKLIEQQPCEKSDMDELDELIEEFEWRASMEGELAKSAFAKESFDSFERYKRNKIKYNRVAELLKELKEYKSKDGKPGHWKPCGILHKCSKCGMCFGTKTSFCPNCGAYIAESEE